jgi:nucleotide-binding universal stress UspA family protein
MTEGQRTKVLVALDGTEEPDVTVATLRGGQPGKQDLVLLAVLPAASGAEVGERGRRALARADRRLATTGARVESDVRFGELAAETVAAARGHGVDMIAMLRHPQPRIERWCLGSVVDDVVSAAPVPVLELCPSERGGVGTGARRVLRCILARRVKRLARFDGEGR